MSRDVALPDGTAILQHLPDAVLVCAKGGAIVFANERTTSLLGHASEDLVGRPIEMLLPESLQALHVRLREEYEKAPQTRAMGKRSDLAALHKSGDWVPVDVSLAKGPSAGQVLVCVRDARTRLKHERELTRAANELRIERDALDRLARELRDSQARLRAMFSAIPAGLVLLDASTRILRMNRAGWLALTGHGDTEQSDRMFVEFVRVEQRAALIAHVAKVSAGAQEIFTLETSGQRLIELRATPFAFEDKRQAYLAVATDVTEEDKLRRRIALAERMASMGTLTAGLAHEINNPLTVVSGNLALAISALAGRDAEPWDAPKLIEMLEEAEDGATRIGGLVRELRGLSRPSDHTVGPVDIGAVVERAISLSKNEVRPRARLVVRTVGELPRVRGNEARLVQVVVNLLVNAAHATPEGSAEEHEIRAESRVAADGRVCIEVADDGCGIAEETLPRIFNPFFTTKDIGQGTGLGLAISHDIVTQHGGEIEVSSRPGNGTTFRVLLPRCASARLASVRPREAAADRSRRLRIVAIDDERGVCSLLHRLVGRLHDVETFTDARLALQRLSRSTDVDVVLCDVMMPDMPADALLGEVGRLDSELAERAILMTGGAYTERGKLLLQATKRCVVRKPFVTELLLAAIEEAASRRGNQEDRRGVTSSEARRS